MSDPIITSVPKDRSIRAFMEQHLLVIGSGTLIALALLGWFLAVRPAIGAYQRVSETSLSDLDLRIDERRSSLKKARLIEEQFLQITPEDYEKLSDVLPSEPGTADLIPNIESIVTLSGLTLESVSVAQSSEGPAIALPDAAAVSALPVNVHPLSVSFWAKGSNYLTFKELLYRIETNLRLLDVPSISFNPKDEMIKMSVSAYYQRTPGVQD
ncbi:MAG: hypothetical protein WC659_02025 [Patescibacteria group bacterium]